MNQERGQRVDPAGAARMPDPTPEPETIKETSLVTRDGYLRHAAAQLAVDYYKAQGTPRAARPGTLKDSAEISGECIVILAKKIEEYLCGGA